MSTFAFLAQASTAPSKPAPAGAPAATQQIPAPPLLWSPFRADLGARTDVIALASIVVIFTVVLFGWALFFRRPSTRALAGRGGVLTDRPSGSRRRRRSNKTQAPIRPTTLKERGGLPPAQDSRGNAENPPPL